MRLGLGLSLTQRRGGTAAPPIALPSGAIGFWDARAYTTTGRDRIPNELGTGASDGNLLAVPRRAYSALLPAWNFTGVTVADCAEMAPDGSMEATRITSASATSWFVGNAVSLPAGTYTVAVTAKDLGGGPNQMMVGHTYGARDNVTLSTEWQRFTKTIVLASPGTISAGIVAQTGGTQANLAFCDIEMFAGAADLNTTWATRKPSRVENADIVFGKSDGAESVTVVDGEIEFPTKLAVLQMPSAIVPTGFTVLFNGSKTTRATSTLELLLAQMPVTGKTHSTFSVGTDTVNGPALLINGNSGPSVQENDGLFGGSGARYSYAITNDGTTERLYVNGALVQSLPRATSFVELRDLFVGSRLGNSAPHNARMGALGVWPRALSDAEVKAAMAYAEQGRTMPENRLVVLEGDSITAQQGPRAGYLVTKPAFGVLKAVVNAMIMGNSGNSLDGRKADIDAIAASAPVGATKILTVLIGANDLGGAPTVEVWRTNLINYLAGRRAAGWKIVLCTLLPQDGATTFNARRATVNAEMRASWVGVHCDAIADYAANAIMGPDNSRSVNPGHWTDGVHPNSTGHSVLAPILAAAIDTL